MTVYDDNGTRLNDRYSQSLYQQKQLQEQAEQRARAEGVSQIERNANELLKQEYIRNQQAKTALPQQTAMLGAGGFSESAAIALEAGYGEGRNKVNLAKQGDIARVNSEADQRISQNAIEYQKALSSWERERAQKAAEQQRYQQQQDYQRQRDEAELSYKKEQDAKEWGFKQKQDDYKREQDAYARRQKELQAAQKTARASAASKKATPKPTVSLLKDSKPAVVSKPKQIIPPKRKPYMLPWKSYLY